MTSWLSLASLVSGGALAYAASRLPGRGAKFEVCAGLLLVGGLALLGASLPRLSW